LDFPALSEERVWAWAWTFDFNLKLEVTSLDS